MSLVSKAERRTYTLEDVKPWSTIQFEVQGKSNINSFLEVQLDDQGVFFKQGDLCLRSSMIVDQPGLLGAPPASFAMIRFPPENEFLNIYVVEQSATNPSLRNHVAPFMIAQSYRVRELDDRSVIVLNVDNGGLSVCLQRNVFEQGQESTCQRIVRWLGMGPGRRNEDLVQRTTEFDQDQSTRLLRGHSYVLKDSILSSGELLSTGYRRCSKFHFNFVQDSSEDCITEVAFCQQQPHVRIVAAGPNNDTESHENTLATRASLNRVKTELCLEAWISEEGASANAASAEQPLRLGLSVNRQDKLLMVRGGFGALDDGETEETFVTIDEDEDGYIHLGELTSLSNQVEIETPSTKKDN